MEDFHFRQALALLDLSTEFGQEIAEKFPEFFDYADDPKEQNWPVPLSVLYSLARAQAVKEHYSLADTDKLFCFSNDWERNDIHLAWFCFSIDPDLCSRQGEPILPDEIAKQVKERGKRAEVGDAFIWKKKNLVLIENNDSCSFMAFVPAECIDVNK
ncbi:MAG: hypothetical protein WCF93_00850 [Candidatus Moraniibacteriota bacterium]